MASPQPPEPDAAAAAQEVAQAALPALRRALGAAVQPAGATPIRRGGRNLVVRGAFAPGTAPVESAVIKWLLPEEVLGFTDWAALQFLSALPAADGVAPRLLADDPERRLFVIEDLGTSHCFEDVLNGHDPGAVIATATALAAQNAALQATTMRVHHARANCQSGEKISWNWSNSRPNQRSCERSPRHGPLAHLAIGPCRRGGWNIGVSVLWLTSVGALVGLWEPRHH